MDVTLDFVNKNGLDFVTAWLRVGFVCLFCLFVFSLLGCQTCGPCAFGCRQSGALNPFPLNCNRDIVCALISKAQLVVESTDTALSQ